MSRHIQSKGQVLFPLALSVIALLGVGGLAVDLALSYIVRAKLGTAVDSAVLAAARADAASRNAVADAMFNANLPANYMLSNARSHTNPTVTGNRLSMTGTAAVPTFLLRVFGPEKMTLNASAEAELASAGTELLLIDEDAIDDGLTVIQTISNTNPPKCGNGSASKCVNDDIANVGVRTKLFTRGLNILPYNGLVLPTGQVGDEGLFRFENPDPQVSQQNGATFTTQQYIWATGPAANENNLDKMTDVVPLRQTEIQALVGKTFCAVVYDSDISVDTSKHTASLKGATLGITAFTVTTTSPNGSKLPKITVNLLSSAGVDSTCNSAQSGSTAVTGDPVLKK